MRWMQSKQLSVYVMHVELICTDDNKNAHVFTYVYTMSSICMFLELIMVSQTKCGTGTQSQQ